MGGFPHWDQAAWFKSTRSAGNGCCVEVAFNDGAVGVRDSKDPHGGVLEFGPRTWASFLTEVKSGQFDI